MVSMASIDDLFRQKPLDEIHVVLKQTRDEVEAKKGELRELVGDHYRSVLESSDHIRAMSECVAQVSTGADRVEELLASMRTLATNPPPVPTAGKPTRGNSNSSIAPEEDVEYTVSLQIMSLLDIPDLVREHLHDFAFVRAARATMVDAVMLQSEVDETLRQRSGSAGEGVFDFSALLRQQASAVCGLPRQIAASCVDSFGAPGLLPASASESFVVHLLMEHTVQPEHLFRRFMRRRADALEGLLGASAAAECGGAGSRLISAAVAVEGTVVVGSALCPPQGGRDPAPHVADALAALLEGALAFTAAEERAAIEGRAVEQGIGVFKRRVESLRVKLLQSGPALQAALSKLGQEMARDWEHDAGSKRLDNRLARLIAAAPPGEMQTCLALSKVLAACIDKVGSHRRELLAGWRPSPEEWDALWVQASASFCPGKPPLKDTLRIVADVIQTACADVVRERVRNLQLTLLSHGEEDADADPAAVGGAIFGGGAADQSGDVQRREEIRDIQRESHIRIAAFDEQLGEILADVKHIAAGDGDIPFPVMSALLTALEERITAVCHTVILPEVDPLWCPSGERSGASAAPARKPQSAWPLQRHAARAAIAFDTLLSFAASTPEAPEQQEQQQHHHNLRGALDAAASSGNASFAQKAQAIVEALRRRSNEAYGAWARIAIVPGESVSAPGSLWRVADDEVAAACGWGSAKFQPRGAAAAAVSPGESVRTVQVPTQASPFVFEQLFLGARRALEVSGNLGFMPPALIAAVKTALSEAFMAAYSEQPLDMGMLKRSGMSHVLQWLFDLKFLRIALSSSLSSDSLDGTMLQQPGSAYEALSGSQASKGLLDTVEAVALSDPVERILIQEVVEAAVKSHVQSVRILLAPLFLHNPTYAWLFQNQPLLKGGAAGDASPKSDDDSFELQYDYAPPLRQQLPRFPLLPVAMASTTLSPAELDPRMGLGPDMDRGAARGNAPNIGAGPPGAGGVTSLMQSVGTFGASLWGAARGPGGASGAGIGGAGRMPEHV